MSPVAKRATPRTLQIGERMRKARLEANLTLREAAPLIAKKLGREKTFTPTTISNWEVGNKEGFLIDEVVAVAKAYGIPLRRLCPDLYSSSGCQSSGPATTCEAA